MCNRYISPETAEAERFWRIEESNSRRPPLPPVNVFPRAQAPFIRRARNVTGYERELVIRPVGPDPLVREGAEAEVPDEQRAQ